MATPFNGSQRVVRIKRTGDPDFVAIALQKDFDSSAKRKLIEFSNKTSGDRSVYLTGLMDEDLKLMVFVSDDTTYADLYEAFDSGETVEVGIYETTDLHPDDDSTWSLVKSADAVIQNLSEKFKHEDIASADVDFKVSGQWTFA